MLLGKALDILCGRRVQLHDANAVAGSDRNLRM